MACSFSNETHYQNASKRNKSKNNSLIIVHSLLACSLLNKKSIAKANKRNKFSMPPPHIQRTILQTNQKTGTKIKFANGLEDRLRRSNCKRTGRQERRNIFASVQEDRNEEPITMIRKTGCDGVGKRAGGMVARVQGI